MRLTLPTIVMFFLMCNFTITLPFLSITDDRDGKIYGAVKIGDVEVMTKNLGYQSISATCYNHLDRYCDHYGSLYHFVEYREEKKIEQKNLCPQGWHIPTVEEWIYLLKRMNPKVTYDIDRQPKYVFEHNYARLQFGGFKSHELDDYYNIGKQGHYFTSSTNGDGEWITVVFRRSYDKDKYEVVFNKKTPVARGVSCRCVKNTINSVVGN